MEAFNRELLERIGRLEITQLTLRDSIAALTARLDSARHVPYSTTDVVEFSAVDVYVERGEYDAATELLLSVMRRLQAWSDSAGTRHRALDAVDARLHQVLVQCAAAAAAPQRRARRVACTLDGSHE
jgi:thioredoxin-like negative regulator of GroEL